MEALRGDPSTVSLEWFHLFGEKARDSGTFYGYIFFLMKARLHIEPSTNTTQTKVGLLALPPSLGPHSVRSLSHQSYNRACEICAH